MWARYVEFEGSPFDLDEERALAFLGEHYRSHPLDQDPECFYYGILAYERSFALDPPSRPLLAKALEAFQAYREQTSAGFTWDPVDDRYADAVASLEARTS